MKRSSHWTRAARVTSGALLVLGSIVMAPTRSEATPSYAYAKSSIYLDREGTGTIPGGDEANPGRFRFYVNPAYQCGNGGAFTLFVVEPPTVAPGQTAPLWVMLHGGGTGYFTPSGTYVSFGGDAANQHEHFWYMVDTLIAATTADDTGLPTDSLVRRRLAQGWRVVFPSMCDHDFYGGMGNAYPNNPLADTVDGLRATLAAIDFTVYGNGNHAGHPTNAVVIHGVSAGAVGAFAVAHAFKDLGARLNGVVMEGYLVGDRWDESVAAQHSVPVSEIDPHKTALEDKIGRFFADPAYWPENAVTTGFDIPLFDVYGKHDQFCGRHPACTDLHAELAAATSAAADLQMSFRVDSGDHEVTKGKCPALDEVDRWLATVPGVVDPPVPTC